jgi:DNA ligase-1
MSSPSRGNRVSSRALTQVIAAAVSAGASPPRSRAPSTTSEQAYASPPRLVAAAAAEGARAANLLGAQSVQLPREIAQQWDAKENKLLKPQQVGIASVRQIYWNCGSCGEQFKKRVRDHVDDKGCCPSCGISASASSKSIAAPASTTMTIKSPARPTSVDVPRHSRDKRMLSPMLAYSWDKYKDRIDPKDDLFVSDKLDGVRCIVACSPQSKRPYFMSRMGNVFESTSWISADLRDAFERDPKLVLDGEIYTHDKNFSEFIGAIKVKKEHRDEKQKAQQQQLKFHAFDLLYADGIDHTTPFTLRLNALERVLGRVTARSDKVALVEHRLALKRDVDDELETALANGYEGVMIRVGDSPYEFGKRSTTLLKHKRMQDAEYQIVDVIEGNGRLEGMVGAIVCRTVESPLITFKANFGVSHEAREDYWIHRKKKLIGKMATVQFQELTPSGVPRFGVFKCVRSNKGGADMV